MLANTITLFRLFLTFGVIAVFDRLYTLDIALIFTITVIFIFDAFDGYIARKRNEISKLGEVLDTLAEQRTHGYPTHGWTHALTRSRISRAIFGITKMLAFTSLASSNVFNHDSLENVSLGFATLAVGFCLLRGLSFFFIRHSSC